MALIGSERLSAGFDTFTWKSDVTRRLIFCVITNTFILAHMSTGILENRVSLLIHVISHHVSYDFLLGMIDGLLPS